MKKKIEEYNLALKNIDFIEPILNGNVQNNYNSIPNLRENSNFEIYCTVCLDACKISNPFISSEQYNEKSNDQNIIIFGS